MPEKNEYIPITEQSLKQSLNFWAHRSGQLADAVLTVPPFYSDWQGNRNATYNISMDTWAAAELAIAGRLVNDANITNQATTSSAKIITSWAKINKGAGNKEGRLYLVYKGSLFLEAYNLIKDYMSIIDRTDFENWVKNIYLKEAIKLRDRYWWFPFIRNNINAEGWLGYVHAKSILISFKEDLYDDYPKFIKFIKTQIDQRSGKMRKEILRTNSGPWYCYVNLVALLKTCLLFYEKTGNNAWEYIKPGIEWYSQYVKYPDSWPYILPGTNSNNPFAKAIGWIWKLMFQCSEEVQKPKPESGWPGDMYEVLLTLQWQCRDFTLNDINAWLETWNRPISMGNVFRQTTSIWCRDRSDLYI
jgi:hypothetical protein